MMKSIGMYLTFMAFVLAAWLFSDSAPFRTEVTVYMAFCPRDARKDGICHTKEEVANPTTYKALVDQQTVVYWTGDSAPSSMKFCAVRDAKNWSCQTGYDSTLHPDSKRELINGELIQTNGGPLDQLFYQAPKWYWWWLRINNM